MRSPRLRHTSSVMFIPRRKLTHLSCILLLLFASLIVTIVLNWSFLCRSISDTDVEPRTDLVHDQQTIVGKDNNCKDIRLFLTFLSEQNGPLCINLRKPLQSEINVRNKHWQAHEDIKNGEDIVVYSAFYDDRKIVGRFPWIRILGVRRSSAKPLWCYIWYSEFDMPIVARAEIDTAGDDQNVTGGFYQQLLFSCPLTRNNSIPTHVSLIHNPCNRSTIFLPIQQPHRSNGFLHEFSICTEVNLGFRPLEWIAEWMELHSMFGVTQVNIYNGSFDVKMDALFDYYRKKGILEMHQMPPAVDDHRSVGIRLGSPASINDCMMRNMHSSRFVIVLDFNDVVVPRVQKSYREMISEIDRSNHLPASYHTYTLRNTYFFQYFAEDATQPKFLKTLRFRQRAPPSEYLFGGTSFVDPRQCKSVFNHYCWTRFNTTGLLSIDVDPSVARSHIYRPDCPFDKKECDDYNKTQEKDDVMLTYSKELMERVPKVLKAIGLQ